jgi:pimeloyl-ACP methyl ester carboxylesterase
MLAGVAPIRARKARYFKDPRLAHRILAPPEPGRFAAAGANGWSNRPALEMATAPPAPVARGVDGEGPEARALAPAMVPVEPQTPTDEFDFDDGPADALAALETRRTDRRLAGAARQAAMDPEGGMELYDCIKAFSETDFTPDLQKVDVPVLILHGEDDQIVPIADSARLAIKLVKKGTLKTYPGLPHGMASTHPEVINADLLAFFKA